MKMLIERTGNSFAAAGISGPGIMRHVVSKAWVAALLALLALPWQAQAAPVSAEEAQTAVRNLLSRGPKPMDANIGQTVSRARTFKGGADEALFHVVNLEEGGFVVTSADTGIMPIIAIAEGDDLVESEENHLWVLLNRDLPQRMEALNAGARFAAQGMRDDDEGRAPDPEQQWASLLARFQPLAAGLSSISDVRVAPLVQSKWNQGAVGGKTVYNYYTPNNYPCGCVATAGAQIMRYHQPTTVLYTPFPAETYSCWVNNAPQNLTTIGGTYDWANMPLNPTSSITDTQRAAIGKLTYDLGVASRMNYGSGGSGAHNCEMVGALKSYFLYMSGFTHIIQNGTSAPADNATVCNALLGSLDAGLPAVLGIHENINNSGHSIVADGYGFNFGVLYAHLNMGWGGSQDAWYNLGNFNVSHYNFTLFDDVSFNISPLQKGEYITGRTLDNNGSPLPGATVTAQDTSNTLMVYTATSNDKGIYAVRVPSDAATYSVAAAAANVCTPSATTVSVQASNMVEYRVISNDTINWNPAKPGTVGNRWGINLTLSATPTSPPSPPTYLYTTSLLNLSIQWTASVGATSYKVFRHTSNSSGSATQIGTTSSVSYNDTTAAAGTTYYYWVKATNSAGDSGFSDVIEGHRIQLPSITIITTASNPSAGGTTSGGGIYNRGAACSVTAAPNSGYNFVNWTEGSTVVSTASTYTFTVSGSRTLTANFVTSTPQNVVITSVTIDASGNVNLVLDNLSAAANVTVCVSHDLANPNGWVEYQADAPNGVVTRTSQHSVRVNAAALNNLPAAFFKVKVE